MRQHGTRRGCESLSVSRHFASLVVVVARLARPSRHQTSVCFTKIAVYLSSPGARFAVFLSCCCCCFAVCFGCAHPSIRGIRSHATAI
jgi:hypothetical protein